MLNNVFYIVTSFLTIFLFVTVDNVISPLVQELQEFYGGPLPTILKLLSSCNLGIVVGTFLGPIILNSWQITRTFLFSAVSFALFLAGFILTSHFDLALVMRFFLGMSSGLFASCFWWVTFQGVQGTRARDAMTSVMMGARPVAISLGVPLLVYFSHRYESWQIAFTILGIAMLLVNVLIVSKLWHVPLGLQTSTNIKAKGDYLMAVRSPHFFSFYASLFLTSCAYFGFYSISGPWFIELYHQTTADLSRLFVFIGLAEVLATFSAPLLVSKIAEKFLFYLSIILGAISYLIFILAVPNLLLVMTVLILFLVLNRIYLFLLVRRLPDFFPGPELNRATLGSLLTLVSWTAFAFVSYAQAELLTFVSYQSVGWGMFFLLIIGFAMSIQLRCKL